MTQILRAVDVQVVPANTNYFTGTVFQGILSAGSESNNVQVVRVTFAPKARTAWHAHPAGQTLHIESGVCLFQTWGDEAKSLSTGDTVIIPAGEKHWHGASPGSVMTHLAIQQPVNGLAADWMEFVSDEQYSGATVR